MLNLNRTLGGGIYLRFLSLPPVALKFWERVGGLPARRMVAECGSLLVGVENPGCWVGDATGLLVASGTGEALGARAWRPRGVVERAR